MKKVICGLIGYGTVGKGFYDLIQLHSNDIKSKTGIEIKIKTVCDIKKIDDINANYTDNWNDIVNDDEIDTVIELIGGIDPAKSIIIESLKKGKNVVTANKKLLAEQGNDIFNQSLKSDGILGFEAAIGGGIPCVISLRNGLVGNTFKSVIGILNGTTNYILTKMEKNKMTFDEALKLAQQNGYAEADPTFDIEGYDAAHKLALLSMLAYNKRVEMGSIYIEGITKINSIDITYALEMGYTIKLLGISKKIKNKLDLRVQPVMLPVNHPLSSVTDEFNAVMYNGDMTGPVLLYGKGAGSYPTASAVVSDVVSIAQKDKNNKDKIYIDGDAECISSSERKLRYYIRLYTEDRAGILSKISGVLGENDISIASVIQKESNLKYVPIVITTHQSLESGMYKAKQQIERFDFVDGEVVIIPIEDNY